jgi:hypothetical protein
VRELALAVARVLWVAAEREISAEGGLASLGLRLAVSSHLLRWLFPRLKPLETPQFAACLVGPFFPARRWDASARLPVTFGSHLGTNAGRCFIN